MRWNNNTPKHGERITRKVFALIPTTMSETDITIWLEFYRETLVYNAPAEAWICVFKETIEK